MEIGKSQDYLVGVDMGIGVVTVFVFITCCFVIVKSLIPKDRERPACEIKDMPTKCNAQIYTNFSEDFFSSVKNVTTVKRKINLPQGYLSVTPNMWREGDSIQANMIFKYDGNYKDLKRLKGIYLQLKIYQGIQYPVLNRWLLVTFLRPFEYFKRHGIICIHVSNITIPVITEKLLVDIEYTSLPSRKRKKRKHISNWENTLDESRVQLMRNIEIVHKDNKDNCTLPRFKVQLRNVTKSIVVDFCHFNITGKLKIFQIILSSEQFSDTVSSVEPGECNKEFTGILYGTYRVQVYAKCNGESHVYEGGNVTIKDTVTEPEVIEEADAESKEINVYIVIGCVFLFLFACIIIINRCYAVVKIFVNPAYRKKIKANQSARTKIKDLGVFIITLDDTLLTRNISHLLCKHRIHFRNILNRTERMQNSIDWVENAVEHSNHFIFIVTKNMYKLYKNRKKRIEDCTVDTLKHSDIDPCLYALMLIRQNYVKEKHDLPVALQRCHLVTHDKKLTDKMSKLYHIFNVPETHIYILPAPFVYKRFSELVVVQKLIRKLKKYGTVIDDDDVEPHLTSGVDSVDYTTKTMETGRSVDEEETFLLQIYSTSELSEEARNTGCNAMLVSDNAVQGYFNKSWNSEDNAVNYSSDQTFSCRQQGSFSDKESNYKEYLYVCEDNQVCYYRPASDTYCGDNISNRTIDNIRWYNTYRDGSLNSVHTAIMPEFRGRNTMLNEHYTELSASPCSRRCKTPSILTAVHGSSCASISFDTELDRNSLAAIVPDDSGFVTRNTESVEKEKLTRRE